MAGFRKFLYFFKFLYSVNSSSELCRRCRGGPRLPAVQHQEGVWRRADHGRQGQRGSRLQRRRPGDRHSLPPTHPAFADCLFATLTARAIGAVTGACPVSPPPHLYNSLPPPLFFWVGQCVWARRDGIADTTLTLWSVRPVPHESIPHRPVRAAVSSARSSSTWLTVPPSRSPRTRRPSAHWRRLATA